MHSLHLLVLQQDSDVLALPCAGAEADVLSCNVQCAREWQLQAAQLVRGRHVHLCYLGTWLLHYVGLRKSTCFVQHGLPHTKREGMPPVVKRIESFIRRTWS